MRILGEFRGFAKGYILVVSIVAIVVILLPGFWPGYSDSFPLSSYPMFTKPRHRVRVDRVIGIVDGPGESEVEKFIPSKLLGTVEVMQAASIVRRAIRGGRVKQRELCRKVAARVAYDPQYSRINKIALIQEFYDPVQYFIAEPKSLRRKWVEQCRVKGP